MACGREQMLVIQGHIHRQKKMFGLFAATVCPGGCVSDTMHMDDDNKLFHICHIS